MDLPKLLKTKITRENFVLVGVLVILLAIPLTVILLGIRQELRKRAAGEDGAILINNGAETTNTPDVTLTLTAPITKLQQGFLKIPQAKFASVSTALAATQCGPVCRSKGYGWSFGWYSYSDGCSSVPGGSILTLVPIDVGDGVCCCMVGPVPTPSAPTPTPRPGAEDCYEACQNAGYERGYCSGNYCSCKDGAVIGYWPPIPCGEMSHTLCPVRGKPGSYEHCCCRGLAGPTPTPTPRPPVPTPTPNQPPICSSISGPSQVATDSWNTFTVSASDPDNGAYPLTYSWSKTCGRFPYPLVGATKTWIAPAEPTTCTISCYVGDGYGGKGDCPDKTVQVVQPPSPTPTPTLSPGTFRKTFYGDSADGWIRGLSDSYSTARSTSAGGWDSEQYLAVGQETPSNNFVVERGYVLFDTSELPDDAQITNVKLCLRLMSDSSHTDSDIRIHKYDFATPILGAREENFDGALSSPFGQTLLNTADISGMDYYCNQVSLDPNWVSKTGFTKYVLLSSRDVGNQASSGYEHVTFLTAESSSQPYLEVVYTSASSPTPTPTPPVGVETMMISNYDDFRDGVEEPFALIKSWTLTEGYGPKTVWAKFKVNGVWTTPVSDSIFFGEGDPGPTPTPTPTPTPGGPGVTLDLVKVWFQYQSQSSARGHEGAIQLALKQGGAVVLEKMVRLDADGEARSVELPGVAPGTYDAFIYEPGYLTKKLTGVVLQESGSELDFTGGESEYFLVGDFDGDQEVGILDFSIFVESYGKEGEEN